jgi:hypothetical protein
MVAKQARREGRTQQVIMVIVLLIQTGQIEENISKALFTLIITSI